MSSSKYLGVGADIGTMNLVAARRTDKGIQSTRMRDAFLDLDPSAEKMLRLSKVDYVTREDELLILGDAAIDVANMFGKEARRPLSQGLIAAGELDGLEVLALLIKQVLGAPKAKDEVCYFSIPAAPMDAPDRDVVYHEGVFERIISDLGYDAISGNEAMAIIYSECAKEGFSGLSMSWGAGMVNVALSVKTIEGMTFSVARGGDWIDSGAARAVGSTASRMCSVKESGLDLMDPKNREEEAIALYYKSLIDYTLKKVTERFKQLRGQFSLPEAVPLVLSGGTSKVGGFEEFFKQVFEKKRKRFPIEISEVRSATDPLNAVAKGLLVQAMQEYT